ncbi:MAG TPA: GTPase HflX [Candidatus Xenobia bacterium]|jgi:GTP-binding protein HflX
MPHETSKPRPRAILVGVSLPGAVDDDTDASLVELGQLVKTLGYDVAGRLTQRREALAGPTVLGEGKLKELGQLTGGPGAVPHRSFARKTKAAARREISPEPSSQPEAPADPVSAVIFDCDLSPLQLSNLQRATGVEVLDRTSVIVEIFSRHARTREARLQVELARLKYLSPRVRLVGRGEDGMGMAGESTIELDRRRIRDRIAELKAEIAEVQKEQAEGRSQRAEQNCVALVGYTNAGKSSLMRALTGSQVLVEDKLFATLDTTVRTLAPPSVPPILISDTVGFIRKLPPDLVASFRSTLEEARSAGVLVYVVDAADVSFRSQLQVTREVLQSLGALEVPSLLVLNKADKLTEETGAQLQNEFPKAILMSAKNPDNVARLRERLIAEFEASLQEEEIFVPYAEQKAVGLLRAQVRVLAERHDDNGTFLRVRADTRHLAGLKRKCGL